MIRAAILGGGAVGQALSRALPAAGVEIALRWSRSRKPRPWTRRLPSLRSCDLVLLAVSDGAVAQVCETLDVGPGQLVVHLAGALPLSALSSARARGAAVGSLHPLRAIRPGEAEPFAGAAAGIGASSKAARGTLTRLARKLGLHPLPVPDGARPLYHAAAMLSAAGQVALFSEAARAFRLATGASERDARQALLPLTLGALGKLQDATAAQALSGPVVRGDAGTVRAHRHALPADLLPLYDLLARASVKLAGEGKRATKAQQAEVERALSEPARRR